MASARETTCSLVSTWPAASITTPEPRLWVVSGTRDSKKSEKKRSKKGSPKGWKGPARLARSVVTFTTEGPTFSTTRTVAVRRRNGSSARADETSARRASPGSNARRATVTPGQRRDRVKGEQGRTLERVMDAFRSRFERRPELAARAPGRVNLIGEHTDYNLGLVLPCAIDRDTIALAAPRDDRRVRVFSLEQGTGVDFALDALARTGDWGDYVKAPAWALAARGLELGGLDLAIASEVPLGAGLSSSAALGVAVARVWLRAAGLELAWQTLAEAVHQGESEFVGVGCGILDPFASALGRRDSALRIDCRDRSWQPVPLGSGRVALLVANSGVRRGLANGSYRERVAECRAALAAARRAGVAPPGAGSLRELGPASLPDLERALEPTLFRRARHVIRENTRVDGFRDAARAGDLATAGALLREGMASLRDDYGASLPELDLLCALGDAAPGCHGSRLTGAGFGGCTLHLVDPAAVADVARAIAAGFARAFGREPPIWAVRPAEGAGDVAL